MVLFFGWLIIPQYRKLINTKKFLTKNNLFSLLTYLSGLSDFYHIPSG